MLDGLGVARPALIEGTHHAYHLYVIEHEQRDALARALRDKGVATGRHYPHAIHEMPAYSQRVRGAKSLPQTQRLYGRSLSLPMFAELSASQVDHVCEALSASVGEVE